MLLLLHRQRECRKREGTKKKKNEKAGGKKKFVGGERIEHSDWTRDLPPVITYDSADTNLSVQTVGGRGEEVFTRVRGYWGARSILNYTMQEVCTSQRTDYSTGRRHSRTLLPAHSWFESNKPLTVDRKNPSCWIPQAVRGPAGHFAVALFLAISSKPSWIQVGERFAVPVGLGDRLIRSKYRVSWLSPLSFCRDCALVYYS